MSTSIDQAFVKQFESDVHLAYQRMGSKLRNTIRTKNNIKGMSTTFQTVGKGTAGTKSRHGDVPIMNLGHAPVECILEDHYAGEYIDKLDELKINHDEKMVAAKSGAGALGRKTDDIILTALDATTNPLNVAIAQIWSTAAPAIALMEGMGANDVPVGDGDLFSVVCWQCWGDLIQIDEFSNADYVGADERPFEGVQAKEWLGMLWFPHSGLLKDGNGDFKQYVYHRTSTGHAIGQDVSADITWQGTKQANLCVYSMSQGAKLIDPVGVIEHVYDVTP
jgi:capsid protein